MTGPFFPAAPRPPAGPRAGGPIAAPPALPADPVQALLQGLHLPALPGVGQLLEPLRSLTAAFGSGAFDGKFVFKESAMALDRTMSASEGALSGLDLLWTGLAAEQAHSTGESARRGGRDLGDQGTSIGEITQNAADAVAHGNAKIGAIAQSFVATAVGLAPVILTPPGQMALMTAISQHLAQALAVVGATQAELGAQAAKLGGVGQAIAIPALPKLDPIAVTDALVTTAQPIADGVIQFASDVGDQIESANKAKNTTVAAPAPAGPPPAPTGPGAPHPPGPTGAHATGAKTFKT